MKTNTPAILKALPTLNRELSAENFASACAVVINEKIEAHNAKRLSLTNSMDELHQKNRKIEDKGVVYKHIQAAVSKMFKDLEKKGVVFGGGDYETGPRFSREVTPELLTHSLTHCAKLPKEALDEIDANQKEINKLHKLRGVEEDSIKALREQLKNIDYQVAKYTLAQKGISDEDLKKVADYLNLGNK